MKIDFWRLLGCALACASAALVVLAMLCLTGCIPVTVRPERDDAGKPIPIAVTPAGGVVAADGSRSDFAPTFDVSDQPPAPPAGFPWASLLQIALTVLGVGGPAAAVLQARRAGRALTAVRLVSGLVDRVAATNSDEEVAAEKQRAAAEQEAAGVRALIQRARGRAT